MQPLRWHIRSFGAAVASAAAPLTAAALRPSRARITQPAHWHGCPRHGAIEPRHRSRSGPCMAAAARSNVRADRVATPRRRAVRPFLPASRRSRQRARPRDGTPRWRLLDRTVVTLPAAAGGCVANAYLMGECAVAGGQSLAWWRHRAWLVLPRCRRRRAARTGASTLAWLVRGINASATQPIATRMWQRLHDVERCRVGARDAQRTLHAATSTVRSPSLTQDDANARSRPLRRICCCCRPRRWPCWAPRAASASRCLCC
jgi:hypothetical protein